MSKSCSRGLSDGIVCCLAETEAEDYAELARLYLTEREHLRLSSPAYDPKLATFEGQRERHLRIVDSGGSLLTVWRGAEVAGLLEITNVVRGPLQSANLGFWVRSSLCGLGVGTRAISLGADHAFGAMRLHRLEAGTRVDNVASQRALSKNDFERIGVARAYLRLDGIWTDHILFQRINGGFRSGEDA